MFQSTHPRGVRLRFRLVSSPFCCFNPRTRVGCDVIDDLAEDPVLFQSTHPRGVRLACVCGDRFFITVSIHAPAWGATPMNYALSMHRVFQSTHPRGVRPSVVDCNIGIHCFNPRTRVGCDGNATGNITALQFQSTHPRGVRPIMAQPFSDEISFNPRTRVGCDKGKTASHKKGEVSIHAPAWGATGVMVGGFMLKRFNPRTRVGCD